MSYVALIYKHNFYNFTFNYCKIGILGYPGVSELPLKHTNITRSKGRHNFSLTITAGCSSHESQLARRLIIISALQLMAHIHISGT